MVPAYRFQSWGDLEQYLVASGAQTDELELLSEQLKKTGAASLTIV
jgi:hypothetical protein